MIKSTKTQIKHFQESFLWADFCSELDIWKKMVSGEFSTCSDLITLGRIQGRIEAIGYLLSLPETLLNLLEDQKNDTRHNKT